jgi:eukaryotic-like serine/threonine-protein kinase
MAHGNAASDDEATEELLPEDVATAAQTTHRRPKRPEPPGGVTGTLRGSTPTAAELELQSEFDIPMVDFGDPLPPVSAPLSPPPISQAAASQPAADPYLGRVIAERYLVERLLGVGSMGLVYRCRHTVLDKTVALKIIRQDLAQDEETVGRFVTEARSASAIGSSHIVEVLDFGTLPDGASYIVMEYLEGLTLGEALDSPNGLSLGDAIDIGIQMTEALGAAHAAGVVHRDLKPDNVFLLQSERGWFVKILDFGIAKIMQSSQKLTAVGSVIGTPHYMSPEQATGARTDARTDIYSLGVILYELACGKVPFDAENPLAVISMQVTDEPPSLRKRMPEGRTLPQGFESVVIKCLAKDSVDRFSSMEDVRAALERIAGGGVPLVAPPSSTKEETDSFIDELNRDTDFRELHAGGRRRRWVARGALLLALAGLAAGVFLLLRPRLFPQPPPRPLPRPVAEIAATPPEPVPSATASALPAPPVSEVIHVALILFPLNSHVFDGDKDLGMMPITIDLVPGETKVVQVVRKGYVTRTLKLDGKKTRIVVGLVSEAAAAKSKGQSQEDAEAEADRAAATLAADETTAEAPIAEDPPTPQPASARLAKGGKTTVKTASEKVEPVEKAESPAPPPAPKRSSKMLAPNPFGD